MPTTRAAQPACVQRRCHHTGCDPSVNPLLRARAGHMATKPRMSAAQYRARVLGIPKYRAVAEEGPDGAGGSRRYRSRLEARLARHLDALRQAGEIVCHIPEVSLPVGKMGAKTVRHVVDQMAIIEIRDDGSFVARFFEAKGFDTATGKRKRKAVQEAYGIPIDVIR